MTEASSTVVRWLFGNRFALWIAFVLVHLHLGFQNLFTTFSPMGDVRYVYKNWMDQAIVADFWVGIDTPWVYPVVAILPMLASYLFGPDLYASTWLSLVMILDAAALATLTGWGRTRRNLRAGWWLLLFLVLLGPIALGRIDTISVAVALVGVLILAAHPIAASVLLSIATWIKVWPAALIAALVIATRHRGAVVASVAGTSVGIALVALAFGSGTNLFSFVTEQTTRSLQVEAPVSTIWLWRAVVGATATVYYNAEINTYELEGDGVALASSLMNPLLGIAAVAVAFLGIRAMRRNADVAELLPVLSLAFVTCLIVFNKVGSPQYVSWLAVPIVLALSASGSVRRLFRGPALVSLLVAALTQLVYPYFYDQLLALDPVMLIIISARNLLLIGLFCWTVVELWRARAPVPREHTSLRSAEEWYRTTWPLSSRDPGVNETPTTRKDSIA